MCALLLTLVTVVVTQPDFGLALWSWRVILIKQAEIISPKPTALSSQSLLKLFIQFTQHDASYKVVNLLYGFYTELAAVKQS